MRFEHFSRRFDHKGGEKSDKSIVLYLCFLLIVKSKAADSMKLVLDLIFNELIIFFTDLSTGRKSKFET